MMEILYFKELESTQKYLVEKIRNGELKAPLMVVADLQTQGMGSRGNSWISVDEGLYFSFVLECVPCDLPLESTSIFYGFIFKEVLVAFGSKIWFKWPNDLYLNGDKIGGVISQNIRGNMVVGIGLNLQSNRDFKSLDIRVNKEDILKEFIKEIKLYSWKQIFSKFRLEFPLNFTQSFHYKDRILKLEDVSLCEDGAIIANDEKIYSLR